MRLHKAGWVLALVWVAITVAIPSPGHAKSETIEALVVRLAEDAARIPYVAEQVRDDVASIGYTEYLGIRVRPGRAIWENAKLGFAVHPMPLGGLHTKPVQLEIVEDGVSKPVVTAADFYEHSLSHDKMPANGDLGVSGFRITAPVNAPSVMDELIVFQGASYFRALSKGQDYGLSARGLSLGTGQPAPEEFPDFKRFWIEKPDGPHRIVIHALLDSPSVTGAFTFKVYPGAPTVIEVAATIFPRRDLATVGIAPLTSMYFYSVGDNTTPARDYRPAVHDSDGLLIRNGSGERLWRPLRNPATLRASRFADENPRGFGLMQRQRDFQQYQDLEARYHRRPSAWIVPIGDWGKGAVELFELPTDSEYHDNIVTQWSPAEPLRANKSYRFAYRLSWPDRSTGDSSPFVNWTRSGPAGLPSTAGTTERFVIDYETPAKVDATLAAARVTASTGAISGVTVQQNDMTGGLRVTFLFDPGGQATIADLRVDLDLPGQPAEVWLYQWASKPTDAL